MTLWVRRLIVANVIVTLATLQSPFLWDLLVLAPGTLLFQPWTLVSHMFMHGGWLHILVNMIGLFFFGPRVESWLGTRSFLSLYFGAGLAGAALALVAFPLAPFGAMVGASGAVLGVVIAFAVRWPDEKIYIYAILPVPAKWFAVGIIGWSLWAGITGAQMGVSHFGHLGGALFGYGYLRYAAWKRGTAQREFQRRLDPAAGQPKSASARKARWESIDVEGLHELNRDEVRRLLEKVRVGGVDSLTAGERGFLERMAGT